VTFLNTRDAAQFALPLIHLIDLIFFVFSLFPHAADGEFILAFARRNVKIDNVHAAAAKRGLEWRVVDEHAEGVAGVEPVYAFTWKK